MPCLAKKPFSTPTKNGSDRAVGKVLTRTRVSSAAAAGPASRTRAAAVAKRMIFTGWALGWRRQAFRDKTVGSVPAGSDSLAGPARSRARRSRMRLGYFTMPVHPMHRNWAETLKEDREAIILADKLGFYDAFMGEHLTDKAENITNSMIFNASLISRHQDHQARHRHQQPVAHASGAGRPARGDVRPPVGGPLHLRRQPRRADLRRRGARHPGAGPQQDVRRGDRRDPGDLGARSALRHRLPGQPLQGFDLAHPGARHRRRLPRQAVPAAAAGDRRHRGGAVLARRRADGQARLPSAVGELPAVQASASRTGRTTARARPRSASSRT